KSVGFRKKRKAGPRERTGLRVTSACAPGRYGATWAANGWLLLPWPVARLRRATLLGLPPCTSRQTAGFATFFIMKTPEPAVVSPLIQAWLFSAVQFLTYILD